MKKVFIIHGFEGTPNGGWRPWLMRELAKRDIYACALPMPNEYEPKKDEWVKVIIDAIGNANEEIYLIGHSLGVPAILRYLETLDDGEKIVGSVLVSGPWKPIRKDKDPEGKIDHFIDQPFDFGKIKNSCGNFSIIHGDDDPIVPFSHAEYFSKNLGGVLRSVKNGKHLSGGAGFFELPEALEELEKMINT